MFIVDVAVNYNDTIHYICECNLQDIQWSIFIKLVNKMAYTEIGIYMAYIIRWLIKKNVGSRNSTF